MSRFRRPKAHIQYSGGIWLVTKDLDFTSEGIPAESMTAWLDDIDMADLVRTYHWWNSLGRGDARFSDNMILRRCQAYQFHKRGKRFPIEHQSRYGQHDIFTAHPNSRFSKPHLQRTKDKAIRRAKCKTAKQQAENYLDMIAAGYCRVSNKLQRVARIDKVDWRERLAHHRTPWDPDASNDASYSDHAGDTYRRCLSKDVVVIIDEEIFKKFPASCGGPSIYLSHVVSEKETK